MNNVNLENRVVQLEKSLKICLEENLSHFQLIKTQLDFIQKLQEKTKVDLDTLQSQLNGVS